MTLSDSDKQTLLKLARITLESLIVYEYNPPPPEQVMPASLEVKAGVFATLKVGEDLRGCIGCESSLHPLWLTTQHAIAGASTRDPRFEPVRPEEVEQIRIHLSVLSPAESLGSPEDFELGIHGLILEKDENRALYLPEVATDQGWDKYNLLESLSVKADLPLDAWKSAKIMRFTTVSFAEPN